MQENVGGIHGRCPRKSYYRVQLLHLRLAIRYVLVNPYILLAALLTVIGAAGAGFLGGRSYESGQNALEESKALKQLNATITRMNDEARDKEQRHAMKVSALANQLLKDKSDAKAKFDLDLAAIRAGSVKLRIPAKCPARPTGEVGTNPSGTTPAAKAELDPAAYDFFAGLTNEGDDAIRERNTCVEMLKADRK